MRKTAIILAIMLVVSVVPTAFATHDYDDIKQKILKKLKKLYNYELVCEPNDNVPLGTTVTCEVIVELKDHKIFDKHPKLKKIFIDLINDLHIKVKDPDGNIVFEEDIKSPKWKDNSSYDDNTDDYIKSRIFSFIVDKPGEWDIDVKVTSFGHKVKKLYTTFFVLPESPIGAIAAIGSSLVVLAIFLNKQRRIA